MPGEVDGAHPAAAELGFDLVLAQDAGLTVGRPAVLGVEGLQLGFDRLSGRRVQADEEFFGVESPAGAGPPRTGCTGR